MKCWPRRAPCMNGGLGVARIIVISVWKSFNPSREFTFTTTIMARRRTEFGVFFGMDLDLELVFCKRGDYKIEGGYQ